MEVWILLAKFYNLISSQLQAAVGNTNFYFESFWSSKQKNNFECTSNVYWRSNFLQKVEQQYRSEKQSLDVDLCYAPFLFITIKVYITLCISAREKAAGKVKESIEKKCFRLAIALPVVLLFVQCLPIYLVLCIVSFKLLYLGQNSNWLKTLVCVI